jgi:alpha-L-fucosidase
MSTETRSTRSRSRTPRSSYVRVETTRIARWLRPAQWVALAAALTASGCAEKEGPVLSDTLGIPTPDPVAPVPSREQLAWQTQELSAFLHFGINTFSNTEQGDGTVPSTMFNPTALDASQWMATLRSAGFRQAMLTAKHADGFCLWPTKCTAYSVAGSPWLAGQGDVVGKFVEAAHQANMRIGLALSPLDRHEPTYGTPNYNMVFDCQLSELLTNYGAIDEIWLWGDVLPAALDWNAIHNLVHRLQPHALLDVGNVAAFANADVRSVGAALPGNPTATDQTSVLTTPGSTSPMLEWYPAEAVHSIRPNWFWHATDDTQLKPLTPSPAGGESLISLYYGSVGRNSVLLLNVPPNTQGLLATPDVDEMVQFGVAIRAIYQSNLVEGRPGIADSVFKSSPDRAASMAVDGKIDTYWAADEGKTTGRIEFDLGSPRTFNVVSIQEPIALGERTTQHHIEAKLNGVWTTIESGTTIGERKLHHSFGTVMGASGIALVITQARALPAIAEIGVYDSPFP